MTVRRIVHFDGDPPTPLNSLSVRKGDPVLFATKGILHNERNRSPPFILFNSRGKLKRKLTADAIKQADSQGLKIVHAIRPQEEALILLADSFTGLLTPTIDHGYPETNLEYLRRNQFASFGVKEAYVGAENITEALANKKGFEVYSQIWPNLLGRSDQRFKLSKIE